MKKHLKTVAFCLSVLIFFQGCTVYKTANVSLEEAAQADTKVRIKTKDDRTLKFKKVYFENNRFYGNILQPDRKVYGRLEKIVIDDENIQIVQVKDRLASTLISIGVPVVIMSVIVSINWERESGNQWIDFSGYRR